MVALRPVGVPCAGVSVNVVEPLELTVAALNEPVTPLGSPDTEKVTMPLNPVAGVTVKMSEPETAGVQRKKKQMGGVTDTLDERAVRENVVFAVTLKL